jgi:uncharacterized protein YacL
VKMPLLVIRALFFLCAVGTGTYLAQLAGKPEDQLLYMTIAGAIAGLLIVTEVFFSRSPIAVVSSITFGTMLGFLAAWLFTGMIEVVAQPYVKDAREVLPAIRLIMTLIFVYFGITLLLQTRDDFKFIIPFVEFKSELKGVRPAILDTSALIDGRFPELCRMGLFDPPIVIPRFVVDELQALADSQDKGKRARGRRGLDVVKSLRDAGRDVDILDRSDPETDGAPVDRRLIALGRALSAALVTTDAALQKVGELDGVRVLNVHDLARALQTRVTAGERLTLKLVKPGEGAEQGVGYLEDGSMVVVEKGRGKVGEEVSVEVTGNIKTSAGQMFFAKMVGDGGRERYSLKVRPLRRIVQSFATPGCYLTLYSPGSQCSYDISRLRSPSSLSRPPRTRRRSTPGSPTAPATTTPPRTGRSTSSRTTPAAPHTTCTSTATRGKPPTCG